MQPDSVNLHTRKKTAPGFPECRTNENGKQTVFSNRRGAGCKGRPWVSIHNLFTEKPNLPLAFLDQLRYDILALRKKEC